MAKDITTIQLTPETLRQLKIRKTLRNFDSYEELIIWMLKITSDSFLSLAESEKMKAEEKIKEYEKS